MDFGVRHSTPQRSADTNHPCPQCRQPALVMSKRHVSPTRLGDELVTEYYDCDCCDARYTYSPADKRWKPLSS